MKKLSHRQRKLLEKIGVIILALVCLVSIVSFIISFRRLYRAGELQPNYTAQGPARVYHPLTVSTINTWMTFNYLNVVFKLPPAYLQHVLDITDQQYPNIRMDTYIRRHDLNADAFLTSIQQAITNYPDK